MMSTKLQIFNVQTLILTSIVLAALYDPCASKHVPDGTSTNSGQKGGCQLSGNTQKSKSSEDCVRQNETNCLVACSHGSKEAESCDSFGYTDEPTQSTPIFVPTTSGYGNYSFNATFNSTINSTSFSFGDVSCQLMDALDTIIESADFSDDQKSYLISVKYDIFVIVTGPTCKKQGWGKWKEHRCRLKKVLKRINKCKKERADVWEICEWEEIDGYGSFLEAQYAMKTVCAQDSSSEIKVTDTSNCTICDALDALADAETQDLNFKADLKLMVIQIRIIFSYTEWDNSQRKGWSWGHIKRLLKKYPNQERKVLDCEFGDSGDDVESFGEGGDIYEKVQGLPDILSGSSQDCLLLKAMRSYYSNESSASVDKRREMKQLCDKLSVYFDANIDISLRFTYCSAQFYQFLLEDVGMTKDLYTLKIQGKDGSDWGCGYDISFCSSFCDNFGCGNKTGGPGKFPAQSDRGRLITPDSSNNTYFYSAFVKGYNTLTVTQKLQCSSSMNSLKACIWSKNLAKCVTDDDKKSGSQCRVDCVSDVISKISITYRVKITVVQIETWYGEKTASNSSYASVSSFCGCS